MPHNEAEERQVSRACPQGPVDTLAGGTGLCRTCVNGAGIVVGAWIGLRTAAEPLGRATKPVEIGVAHDGLNRPVLAHPLDQLGGYHLGTGPVLGLGRKDEARVVPVACVHHVIVVIDPRGEPRAELLDEGLGDLREASARRLGREGHVEDDDPSRELPARVGACGAKRRRARGAWGQRT